MRVSIGLPWGGTWADGSPVSGEDLVHLARSAEVAGFGAVYATDHPAPPRRWLDSGGHPTLDPFVALSFVASATTSIWLHTNLFVAPYRHPLLAAKAVASLVALAGRRVVVGVGTGYLKAEFAALGVDFDRRNELTDEAIVAMRQAWKGAEVNGSVVRPVPKADLRPPIWVGGNSRRAIERAAALAQGWCPMPSPAAAASTLRTPGIETVDDLASRIALARDLCEAAGRTEPLTICFSPRWGSLPAHTMPEPDRAVAELTDLGAVGVSWATVALPGASRQEMISNIERYGDEVVRAVAGEGPES